MIKTLVISLKDRKDRRDAFTLPWDFDYVLQDRITLKGLSDYERSNMGAAAAHRSAIQIANDNGWDEVLVLEDDAVYVPDKMPLESLGSVTFLGGIGTGSTQARRVSDSTFAVKNISAAHAVIYRREVFSAILASIPSNYSISSTPSITRPYEWWLTQNEVFMYASPSFEMLEGCDAAKGETQGNNERDLNKEQREFYKQLNQL